MLIPQENAKDLAEIPDNVKSALEIIPVSNVDEVLQHALTSKIKKIKWTKSDAAALAGLAFGSQGGSQGGDLGDGKAAH